MVPKNKSKLTFVKFPREREELLRLAQEDQEEIRENSKRIGDMTSKAEQERQFTVIASHCHLRAQRMLAILSEIKIPTVENIGKDGCEALLLLTQHSYLSVMKKIQDIVERIFKHDPNNVAAAYIPALKDRISILEYRKQLYATQWTVNKNGEPFLIAVYDFPHVNERRAVYGLQPVRRPVNLAAGAIKYPLGRGLAKATDQKPLTDEEYQQYSAHYLKREI
jgi:hypothetical protein